MPGKLTKEKNNLLLSNPRARALVKVSYGLFEDNAVSSCGLHCTRECEVGSEFARKITAADSSAKVIQN